jgi:hypothetical protein
LASRYDVAYTPELKIRDVAILSAIPAIMLEKFNPAIHLIAVLRQFSIRITHCIRADITMSVSR